MATKNQHTDRLVIVGINSKGFGTVPKMLTTDLRLKIESKAIYSYIASYAGAGNTAFPGLELMLKHLGISPNRFYKFFNPLKYYGYITVDKERSTGKEKDSAKKGTYEHCIYTLNTDIPRPYVEDEPLIQIEEVVNLECPRAEDRPLIQIEEVVKGPLIEYPLVENEEANINSLNNIYTPTFSTSPSTITNPIVSQSVSQSDEAVATVDGQTDGPEHVLEKIDWDYLKQERIPKDFLEDVELMIELMWHLNTYDINGATLPRKTIRKVLEKLDHNCIEFAYNKYDEYSRTGEVRNSQKYLQAILFNSAFEGVAMMAHRNFNVHGNGRKSNTPTRVK